MNRKSLFTAGRARNRRTRWIYKFLKNQTVFYPLWVNSSTPCTSLPDRPKPKFASARFQQSFHDNLIGPLGLRGRLSVVTDIVRTEEMLASRRSTPTSQDHVSPTSRL